MRCLSAFCSVCARVLTSRLLPIRSYDNGTKPYPDNPTLLKRFATLLQPNVRYTLRMQFLANATNFLLLDGSPQPKLLEQQTVHHAHQCKQFNEGYRLGLYFGGGCPAPSEVTVCYRNG